MANPEDIRGKFPDLAWTPMDWTDKVVVVSGNLETADRATVLSLIAESEGFGAKAFFFLHPGETIEAYSIEQLESMLDELKEQDEDDG